MAARSGAGGAPAGGGETGPAGGRGGRPGRRRPERVALIVARDRAGVIGANGRLPWHLPADLRRFRALTMGKPLLMGRRTYESIGRPLPGRRSIVLSRDPRFCAPGCEVAHSLDEALERAAAAGVEIMIGGGAELYRQALPLAGRVYLTQVQAHCRGGLRFPPLPPAEWREVERRERPPDARNSYPLSFIVLERCRPGTGPRESATAPGSGAGPPGAGP